MITVHHKEIFKNEVKSIASKRRLSKERAEILQKKSQRNLFKLTLKQEVDDEKIGKEIERARVASYLMKDSAERARYLNLAYGFIRGVPYKKIEKKTINPPIPTLLYQIILEFYSPISLSSIEIYLKEE